MYNRPNSYTRYQEPTAEQINLKEKQLYLQSSSINPLTGQPIRQDASSQYGQPGINSNLEKKVALQSSSLNPLTGAPVLRNPLAYAQTAQPQTIPGAANDPRFQRNLERFFAADDPNPPPKQRETVPNDPRFQKNLEKFFAADDPNPPPRPRQQQPPNDPRFQKNLEKFFAADDPRPVVRPRQSRGNNDRNGASRQAYGQPAQQQPYQNYPPHQQTPQQVSQKAYGQGHDSQDQRVLQDPYFQKNLTKFFAADDNSVPRKLQNNANYQQQKQVSLIEQQRQQKLEQDPRFQKNLQQFFAVEDNQRSGQGVQGAIQPSLSKQTKVVAIADSSSAARNQLTSFFRTRGVDDFDVFAIPGGAFALASNPVWEQGLKSYLETLERGYNIKELYIISGLDQNSNTRLFTNFNDKRSHQIAIEDLRNILTNKLGVQYRVNGILIDQRGASEKLF